MTDDLMHRSTQAAFPPGTLMQRVSGLTSRADFAQHGRDIFAALRAASPTPLFDFKSILDFGVGCGRLARMFHDFTGSYTGADVDGELVDWVNNSLPWVRASTTVAKQRLPFPDSAFDCVISISVFTHMNEADSKLYLDELHRVTRPGSILLLTVHGMRCVERALAENQIEKMLAISPAAIIESYRRLLDRAEGFHFADQTTHLSTEAYDYGETFVSENYVRREWGRRFEVIRIVRGAIHDFQDIVVLRH